MANSEYSAQVILEEVGSAFFNSSPLCYTEVIQLYGFESTLLFDLCVCLRENRIELSV